MQTEHLFELTYIILDKKQVTASQMAEHFGVSQRTIYRWIDALDLAGVPVITTKGKGGGIMLSEKYTLDKAVLTEEEKQEILASVQALQILSGGSNSAASKLKAITKANADWIHVDFAPWNPEQAKVRELFTQLKSAILGRHQISMEYYSSHSGSMIRTIHPWKLIFKGQSWYLYGFCSKRKAPRYFKLSRMSSLKILKDGITEEEKNYPEENQKDCKSYGGDKATEFVQLKVRIDNSEIYRILDEYKIESIEEFDENSKILAFIVPRIYWLKNWILSFGASMHVIEPEEIRRDIQREIKIMYQDGNSK